MLQKRHALLCLVDGLAVTFVQPIQIILIIASKCMIIYVVSYMDDLCPERLDLHKAMCLKTAVKIQSCICE